MATFTITWENIRYRNGDLYHDEYFTDGNTRNNSHVQQVRIPVKKNKPSALSTAYPKHKSVFL